MWLLKIILFWLLMTLLNKLQAAIGITNSKMHQKHRAEVIRIGAEHFAALAAGTPAEGSSKRRKHSHPTRNHPQLFDEGYELDQSMASRALLSALELYLGATVFDGLEETHNG
ncbi:hypothetical protein HYQ46_005499 [Verticillium longisporum]|nr:hypothetical protein HYQ44_002946 [Verticillium longisporum]KAG7152792.1 hypothetical protein HYQ46_005499 [Verticillium longisporum]